MHKILSYSLFYLAALTFAQASELIDPSCPDKCGNVSIPYPFGTAQGCYLNEDFFIHCNGTPYIGNSSYKHSVVNLSAVNGEVSISTPIIKDCYNTSNSTLKNFTITTPKFPVSPTRNKLTSVGCDSIAMISNISFAGGCISYCDNLGIVDEGVCTGVGCCQTPNLPKGLLSYSVIVISALKYSSNKSGSMLCDYAFLADENFYKFKKADLHGFGHTSVVPTVLEWSIGNKSCDEAISSAGYACTMQHTFCVNSDNGPGYRCQCSDGFEDNPYIPNGCQDICKHKTCNSEIIKFVSIGASIFGVAVVVSSFLLWRHFRKRMLMKRRKSYFHQNGGLILQENLALLEDAHTAFRIFTAEEMEEATNNFDEGKIVGRGGFGVVYKGYLSDGREVAIKKSKSVEQYEIDQFINEVVLLSKIQHQNVVGFYGCCLETSAPLLVNEFITNETLFDHLYSEGTKAVLSWKTRLKIASETSGVLAYLHHDHRPPIIHSDIKPHNILLDDSFNAKVSDFGISKLAPQNEDELCTKVKGTLGYLDPEFIRTSQLTEKSDVYSFGVVLLELITGQRVFSFDRDDEDRNLVKYFETFVNEGQIVEVFDKMIANEEDIEQLKKVARLAGRCVRVKGEDRPNMKEVAMELGSLWMEVKQWWTPQDSLIEQRPKNINQHDKATSSLGYSPSGDHSLLLSMLNPR